MLRQLLLILLVTYASCSHYRGGSVSWDIRQSDYVLNSSTIQVRVHQRHSWRRSAAPSFWGTAVCSASTIANGTALLGENYFYCNSNDCLNSVSYTDQSISTQVLCTDFSEDYDYASGEKYTMLQLPINKTFVYTFSSCCWIPLLPQLDTPDWILNLVINTHRRIDGTFNSAPVSTMNPVVKVQVGQTHIINIPMADIDGDQIRCRWGLNYSESGGIYESKGNLQPYPCQLTYNATQVGYEGIAVVIEDFDSNNHVLSSIPLQFLIEIVPALPDITTPAPLPDNVTITVDFTTPPPVCPNPPEYVGDWGPSACIGVASNNVTEIRVVVKIPCGNSSTSIRDILTISPTGMIKGPITQDPQDSDKYIMYLQWTPNRSQYGIHPLCVTPVDSSGQSGQTVCFNLLVDVHSPHFVLGSMSPTGVVSQNESTWTIATDVDIVPPTDPSVSAVIYKRSDGGSDVYVFRVNMSTADYQSRQITFNTDNITWEQGQEYYILLDGGVATINQSCGIQSAPIIDTHFWTFSIAAAPTTAEVTSTTTTPEETTITITTIPEGTTDTTTTTPKETTITTTATPEGTTDTTTTIPKETTITTTITPEETTLTTTTTTTIHDEASTIVTTTTSTKASNTTTTPESISTSTTTAVPTIETSSSSTTTTDTTTPVTTLTTTTTTSNPECSEWLPFGTIKNVTTSDNQRNYSFCFNVNTTLADVTISANTWTPCAIWKTSGAADPLMDMYNITNNPILLAQNDDGNSIPELNCYAAVLSYRLNRGNYRILIRHPKCNYGKFEVRLSAETTNAYK